MLHLLKIGFLASPLSWKKKNSHAEHSLPPGNDGVQLGAPASSKQDPRPSTYHLTSRCSTVRPGCVAIAGIRAFNLGSKEPDPVILNLCSSVCLRLLQTLAVSVSKGTEENLLLHCSRIPQSLLIPALALQPSPHPLVLGTPE